MRRWSGKAVVVVAQHHRKCSAGAQTGRCRSSRQQPFRVLHQVSTLNKSVKGYYVVQTGLSAFFSATDSHV